MHTPSASRSAPRGHRTVGLLGYPLLLWLALETALLRVPGAVLLLALIPLGVGWAVVGPRRWRRYGLALATAAALAYVTYDPIFEWQVNRARQRGQGVVMALDAYAADRGRYPDSLAQLVPALLPRLPTTGLGVLRPYPFHYRPPGSGRPTFSFWFGRGGASIERYSKASDRWTFVRPRTGSL